MKSNRSSKSLINSTPENPSLIEQHTCAFCKKAFSKESILIAHSCEKKRRWFAKDTREVSLGLYAYIRFYEISYKQTQGNQKTFEQFASSPFYSMFVRFGKYLLTVHVINQDGFIEFLVKGGHKLKNWMDDTVYQDWIKEFCYRESPYAAFERSVLLMQQWAKDNDEDWSNFFRNVNPQLATSWIRNGKISPWILYSESGNALITRLSDEQLELINPMIDPIFWAQKLKLNFDDLKQVNLLLKEFGI